MMTHCGLCAFFIARETPVTVPPVPAPAMKTSTFPEEGRKSVEGVEVTASIISGPVVYSCASGLFGYVNRNETGKKIKINK